MAFVSLHGIAKEGLGEKVDIIFSNYPLAMVLLTHHIQSPLGIFHVIDMGIDIQIAHSHLEISHMDHLLWQQYTFGLHQDSSISARVKKILTVGHIDRPARGYIHRNPSGGTLAYLTIPYIEFELAEGMYPLDRQ